MSTATAVKVWVCLLLVILFVCWFTGDYGPLTAMGI